MPKQKDINIFDDEPITYCSKCYSLKIKYEDSIGMDCCGDCGCTDFITSSMEEWEKLFQKRYGHKFVEEKGDIRKSPIFQMSNDKLKEELFKCSEWREVCSTLYPAFPEWLGKADSVILLFAKLYQDNRLDELKLELVKQNKNKGYGRAKEGKNNVNENK